ncbi:Beta-galactosidase, partial [Tetrabaena socialis]
HRFLKGAALSVWQNSPDEFSQWTAFALRPHSLRERLAGKCRQLRIDSCSDFWNRYHDDIACARQLGSNSLRLSLEWGRVMPEGPGRVDEAAVARYRAILDACGAAGLEPMVTLHHFAHPAWFEALGGFEREENIRYFEEWAVIAFRLFRHIVGIHAPGRKGAVATAGRVLLCMLRAHSAAYRAIRRQAGGEDVRIGLVHQTIRFEAEGSGALHAAARWTAGWLTHCFGWDVVHHYLMSGRFSWRLPGRVGGWAMVEVQEPGGRPPCDWLGINYYTRVVLDWRLGFTCRPGEVLTDMGWPVVPGGLYGAIAHCSELGVPLYVTETGIADGRDDRRGGLIAAYWKEVGRAVADGHDVRGFYYWTLVDNYEWHLGYNMKFGLYEWTGAPPHPNINAAAAAAAAAAVTAAAAAAATAAATTAAAAAAAVKPSSGRRRIAVGPSDTATATAVVIEISPPGTPWPRHKRTDSDAGSADVDADAGDGAGAGAPECWHAAARAAGEAAVEAARESAGRWEGRRLRPGALELVRRFAATPHDLLAARRALAEMVWPHVPLPAGLMRPWPEQAGPG